MKKKYRLFLHWAIPEKKQTKGRGGRGYGISRVIKVIECGIFRGDQERIMLNFEGSWFLVLEFPTDVTPFCTVSTRGGELICLKFPRK